MLNLHKKVQGIAKGPRALEAAHKKQFGPLIGALVAPSSRLYKKLLKMCYRPVCVMICRTLLVRQATSAKCLGAAHYAARGFSLLSAARSVGAATTGLRQRSALAKQGRPVPG